MRFDYYFRGGLVPGTVRALRAIVPDANKVIDTIDITTLKIGGVTLGASGTQFNFLSGVTAGTVIASKAIVTDSGIKITGLLNCTYGAGTATVAPVVYTTGTNLTTAAAGAVEFDGTCFYQTAIASTRQLVPTEQFVRQVADSAAANNTGLDTNAAASVFGLGVTLTAATTYAFEGEYYLTNTGTTSHTWSVLFGLTASLSFTSIGYSLLGNSFGTANTPASGILTGFAAAATAIVVTAASTSATEQVVVKVKGVMRVNAGGTLTPQMQASARPGATGTPGVVVKAGSFFRIWPIGSATVASVGNWA